MAILKQPEALAGAVQQGRRGGGVGIVFRLATVTIYSAKRNKGGETDTECLSQCSFLDGIRTVRMSLDLHFCGVDYMCCCGKIPGLKLLLDIVRKNCVK